MAVTVPRCGPEVVNWLLSDDYHDIPGGHIRIYRRSELARRLRAAGLVPVGQPPRPRAALALLVAAVPGRAANDANRAVAAYHRFLVWDIVKAPLLTRLLERVLGPLIGKSLVVYVEKPGTADRRSAAPAAAPAEAAAA